MTSSVVKPLRYAVLGTGAVGGFYGSQLLRAGVEVHFLAHSDFDHIRKHGLLVESPRGSIRCKPVSVYRSVRAMPKCDVVLVTLKATHNHLLRRWLPHVTRRRSLVVLVQNGIGFEERIAELFPNLEIAGGLAFLCSTKIGPGHIRHLDYGALTLAPYARNKKRTRIPAALVQVANDFRRAGIDVSILPDLMLARWRKLVWNVPFNGLSVVHKARTDQIMKNPNLRKKVVELMNEVVRIARAYGYHIPRSFVEKMVRDTERMKPYRTSMMVDFLRGRPMEIEAIYGNPLRLARAAHVSVPNLKALYQQLREIQRSLRNRQRATTAN